MKKVIIFSLLFGMCLTASSLLFPFSQKIIPAHPPCVIHGSTCIEIGIGIYPPPAQSNITLGYKGIPFSFIEFQKDEDQKDFMYIDLSIASLLGDIALFSVTTFLIVDIITRLKEMHKKDPTKGLTISYLKNDEEIPS